MSSAIEDLRETVRPLAFPAAATAILLFVSFAFFSMAGVVDVPPAPDDLFVRHVQIDHLTRTEQRFERRGRPGYYNSRVALLGSDDFDGVTFRLMGAARFVTVPVPATLELHMVSDPQAAADVHRRLPNVSTQIDVFGVRYRDEVLADPVAHYEAAAWRQWRYRLFGYGALVLVVVTGTITLRKAHGVWREMI